MEYFFFPNHPALIIRSVVFLPIGWLMMMFAFQLVHWGWGWINDSKTRVNLMMEWTMIHILNYRINYKREGALFIKPTTETLISSDGSIAIFGVSAALAVIPLMIACLIEFYIAVGTIASCIAFMFIVRQVVRINKALGKHIRNITVHNKENL